MAEGERVGDVTVPIGTVTFLFSDIEGSTKRWARDRAAMQDALRVHDRLMREAVVTNGGYVFKTMGDAFFAAFAGPDAAAAAALDAQRALAAADFSAVDGLGVRMALNTGTADERDGDYFGPTLNFVARLLPLGHGGQVLLSAGTAALVRRDLPPHATLVDLGEHTLKDIDGYERVYQLVAPGLRRDFPELRSQQALQPWLVPEAMRTRHFTGRDDVLDQVRRQLLERHRAALSGLGGVGKTQAAIEYAIRHRTEYPNGVFWIDAETVGGLTSGFVEIAKALQLPAAESNDQEEAVKAVLARLNRIEGWLLILDNVEDRSEVRRFVPERDKGDVLITSRESVFAELGIPRVVEVGELDREESLRFLLTRTGRKDDNGADPSSAGELAAELGNLPLALEQAAAYIAETGVTFASYLTAFRKRRLSLLERAVGLVAHDTVAVTWTANFEAVERASPAAADALRLSAFLAPDAIPYELFLNGAHLLGQPLAQALADPDDLAMAEVLRPLARYSLIRSDAASRVFGVHRLVQEIATAALPEAERRAYVERVVCALDATFPEVAHTSWVQCERLVRHVASIDRWVDDSVGRPETFGRVLNDAGKYLWERGRYAEARPLYERALAIREEALGPDHSDVAQTLNSLALLHRDQGRYAEAQLLYEHALAIGEKAVEPNNPDIALSLNGLAILHFDQGRYAEAQPLFERGLAIREKVLGPDHPDVAKSLNGLASVHTDQGRYAEAQPLIERGLAIREQALGLDHPDVASSLNSLGNLHREQGRYAEAQPLFERALGIREKALGPDHPGVAVSLNNLAAVHNDRGRSAEAQPLYERALGIWEKALGPDHPHVATTLNNLAEHHRIQGRVAEAERLYQRALPIYEHALGSDHPDFALTLISLANVYMDQQRYAGAELLYERALGIQERALGSDHRRLTDTLVGFASVRKQQGRVADARDLYERALVIKESVYGADHPEVTEMRNTIDTLRAVT